jgi:hypothetical protein
LSVTCARARAIISFVAQNMLGTRDRLPSYLPLSLLTPPRFWKTRPFRRGRALPTPPPPRAQGWGASVRHMLFEQRDGLIFCSSFPCSRAPLLGSGRIQPSVRGMPDVLVCTLTSSRRRPSIQQQAFAQFRTLVLPNRTREVRSWHPPCLIIISLTIP